MIDETKGFSLVRLLDTTAQRIWRAWTDPGEASLWWHPTGMTTPLETVSIDPRVGGEYRYTMVDDLSGQEYPTGGVYREVVENELLVFTWGIPGDENAPLVSVSIESAGDLTRLSFELRGVDGVSGDNS